MFEDVLAGTLEPAGTTGLPPFGLSGAQTPGLRALAVATGELGVAEEPPGSNDGARIASYRSAVAGSYAGAPWCAYFVSWAAREAGMPLGDAGEGFGAVEQIADWAARTGRLVPAGSAPSPGDLILFGGRHVGIVESVSPDGSLTTIEGNEGNAVRRVERAAGEATGFVRL
jgi:CHAP domain-containing protein